MIGMDGIPFFECTTGPLAPGAMATTEIMVTATTVGVFRNIASSFTTAGACGPGSTSPGAACEEDATCGGTGECLGGRCDGEGNGVGCSSEVPCQVGTCVPCSVCASGTCAGGEEEGESCSGDEDCGQDGMCVCGAPFACTTTTVVAVPQGGECTDTAQCASGLTCADGVCCTSACDGPLEACNTPGDPGVCVQLTAPAPTLSPLGWSVAVGALLLVGAAAVRRRGLRREPGSEV
jgi:hypothetical protein